MLYKCLHIDFKLIPDKLLHPKTAVWAKNGLDVSLAEAKYESEALFFIDFKHKIS